MECLFAAVVVCPYLFCTNINFRSFLPSFPHAVCDVMVGASLFLGCNLATRRESSVACLIPPLFTYTSTHFQSWAHPTKNNLWFSNFLYCTGNSVRLHPGNPARLLTYAHNVLRRSRTVVAAILVRTSLCQILEGQRVIFRGDSQKKSECEWDIFLRRATSKPAGPLDPYRLWPSLYFSHQLKHSPLLLFPIYKYSLLDCPRFPNSFSLVPHHFCLLV